jgi:hypothetical protein
MPILVEQYSEIKKVAKVVLAFSKKTTSQNIITLCTQFVKKRFKELKERKTETEEKLKLKKGAKKTTSPPSKKQALSSGDLFDLPKVTKKAKGKIQIITDVTEELPKKVEFIPISLFISFPPSKQLLL